MEQEHFIEGLNEMVSKVMLPVFMIVGDAIHMKNSYGIKGNKLASKN